MHCAKFNTLFTNWTIGLLNSSTTIIIYNVASHWWYQELFSVNVTKIAGNCEFGQICATLIMSGD